MAIKKSAMRETPTRKMVTRPPVVTKPVTSGTTSASKPRPSIKGAVDNRVSQITAKTGTTKPPVASNQIVGGTKQFSTYGGERKVAKRMLRKKI